MTSSSKAVVYSEHGAPDVLRLIAVPRPQPAAGEIVVQIVRSGINPTDSKSRQGTGGNVGAGSDVTVPHHDGSGIVAEVGADVEGFAVGDRVWVVLAGHGNPMGGTAQEFAAVPAGRVFHLPDEASFDEGASVGIPALTAHRALTVGEGLPSRLSPGSLAGKTILVSGGAGAVGHAAIQLAVWAGASVITTVSSPTKRSLAEAAGATFVVTYTEPDVVGKIRTLAPDGVDLVVEVAASANSSLNMAVLAPQGTIAVYGNDRGGPLGIDFFGSLTLNLRYQFILLYTLSVADLHAGADDVNAALTSGALSVGEAAGLPLTSFPLEQVQAAHEAIEAGTPGKILIHVA